MRWYRFGTDFFVCDCEKRKMYWMYIEFFGKKQAGKDVPKMCRRLNQRFLYSSISSSRFMAARVLSVLEKAVRRKKPSPLLPKPAPGVPTIPAPVRRRSK